MCIIWEIRHFNRGKSPSSHSRHVIRAAPVRGNDATYRGTLPGFQGKGTEDPAPGGTLWKEVPSLHRLFKCSNPCHGFLSDIRKIPHLYRGPHALCNLTLLLFLTPPSPLAPCLRAFAPATPGPRSLCSTWLTPSLPGGLHGAVTCQREVPVQPLHIKQHPACLSEPLLTYYSLL